MCSNCSEASEYCPTCGYLACECELDPLQVLLAECYATQQKLNASRDTQAVRASNANTALLIEKLGL